MVIIFLVTLRVDGKQKYGYPMPCSTMVIILIGYQKNNSCQNFCDDISSVFLHVILGQMNDIQTGVRSSEKLFSE